MRDYEELVKALRENAEWAEGNIWEVPIMLPDNLKQAADAIEDLIAALTASNEVIAKSGNRWISVEERLPEVDQPVMICAFGKSVGEGIYRGHDGFHHVWKMYASSGTYWDGEVTHYMPLPEPPPKEDGNA